MINSGKWIFNEDKSVLDRFGISFVPYKISVIQVGDSISIIKTVIVEYADDQVIEESYTMDGREYESRFMNFPAKTSVKPSKDKKSITIRTKAKFGMPGQESESITDETWSLLDSNETLLIKQTSSTPRGKRDVSLVYDRM
jgi:hypothetical protein